MLPAHQYYVQGYATVMLAVQNVEEEACKCTHAHKAMYSPPRNATDSGCVLTKILLLLRIQKSKFPGTRTVVRETNVNKAQMNHSKNIPHKRITARRR